MQRSELTEFLRERPRVGDGALGTALYTGGIAARRSFDDLNRSDPDRVRAIHAAHRAAGADLIGTNTFGANHWKLARHGLASEVAAINAAGVAIARRAAGQDTLVLGSVGPSGQIVGPLDEDKTPEIADGFREQIAALVEAGVDAVLIETFTSLSEARVVLGAAREVAPDIGVIVLMTFSDQATTLFGISADQAGAALERDGADAIGSNCGVGPDSTLTALERMREAVTLPLVAQPNAGIPERIEGRFLYPSSPDYVAHYAKRYLRLGVSLIGGCCGTGAEHIGAVAGAVRAASAGMRPARPGGASPSPPQTAGESAPVGVAPIEVPERSGLARTLAEGRFAVSVEMDPPRGADPGKFLGKARELADAGIRFVNIADGPRASARMSAIAFAALLERSGHVETILHYQCRDRNLIGIQADLLGAHALGIRNLLAVTGDPPKLGDYPHATPVFDVNSVGLVRILGGLNQGLDLAGNPLGGALPFYIGVGANPAAADLDTEMRKFDKKIQAGAHYCLTQPVYEPHLLETFLASVREHPVPVLVGVLPLVSSRNAEFLHNEVPGMTVPQSVPRPPRGRSHPATRPGRWRVRGPGNGRGRPRTRGGGVCDAAVQPLRPGHPGAWPGSFEMVVARPDRQVGESGG